MDRREFLSGAALLTAALAGCSQPRKGADLSTTGATDTMPYNAVNGEGAQALHIETVLNWIRGDAVVSGCDPSDGMNAMEVDIASGTVRVDGSNVSVSAQTVALTTGGTDPRKDLIWIDNTGTVQVAIGIEAPYLPSGKTGFNTHQPSPPDSTGVNGAVVAEVIVDAGASDIDGTPGQDLRDRRVFSNLNANSVETDEVNNTQYVSEATSRADVNTMLSTPGTVLFRPGSHLYADRLEVTSNNVHIVIEAGATVGFANSNTATGVDRGNGTTVPVIYSSGYDNVTIENRGVIDGNNPNTASGSSGMFIDAGTSCAYLGHGGRISRCHDCIWWVDADQGRLVNPVSADYVASVVAMEGSRECEISQAIGLNGGEVIDLNHSNENCTVEGVYGVNLTTGAGDQVIDVNNSPGTSVRTVRGRGVETFVSVRDDSGARFTQRVTSSTCEDVTVADVEGTSESTAIHAYATTSASGLTLTDFNVESTAGNGVLLEPAVANALDDVTLRGRAVATSTGATNYSGIAAGKHGNQQAGLDLCVVAESANHTGLEIKEWDDVTGYAKAHDCPQSGVSLASLNTETCDNVSLRVNIQNAGTYGFITAGGGAKNNMHISGVAVGSGTTDVRFEGTADARADVQHSTFARAAGNTRVAINGWGINDGDPSLGGQWNAAGYEGVNVRDTTNGANYAYVNGGWVAL